MTDSSLLIGSRIVPSRYFLAPINTGFCVDGSPCRGLLRFHEERSGKGIGISYVGNVAIAKKWAVSPSTGYLEDAGPWGRVAEGIAGQGSLPGIQLACKVTSTPTSAKWRNVRVADYVDSEREEVSKIGDGTIEEIIAAFVDCASRAIDAGFTVLQIHAAHGYFLSQLLSEVINQRSDRFGRDRALPLVKIVEGIKKLEGKTILDVRLSLTDGIGASEREIERTHKVVQRLVNVGVDMISFSNGMYNVNRFDIYPSKAEGHACYLAKVKELSSWDSKTIWNVAGNFWDLQSIQSQMSSNLTVSIGRALIANPFFVQDSLSATTRHSNCERSGHCHFYSRNQPHISCRMNSNLADGSDLLEPL